MSTDRLTDLLDLNEVPRWNSKVRLLRRQTVAEHTFNVMAIASEIVVKLDGRAFPQMSDKHRMMYWVLRWALHHDGPECETGDINYLFKKNFRHSEIDDMEVALCPWMKSEWQEVPAWARAIVKIADKIEEYLFITKWCQEDEASRWTPCILDQIVGHIAKANAAYGWENLPDVVGGILNPERLVPWAFWFRSRLSDLTAPAADSSSSPDQTATASAPVDNPGSEPQPKSQESGS